MRRCELEAICDAVDVILLRVGFVGRVVGGSGALLLNFKFDSPSARGVDGVAEALATRLRAERVLINRHANGLTIVILRGGDKQTKQEAPTTKAGARG